MLIVLVSFLVDRLWLHLGHWKSRRQMRRYQFFLPITVANLIIERWVLLFYGGGVADCCVCLADCLVSLSIWRIVCAVRQSIGQAKDTCSVAAWQASVASSTDFFFSFFFVSTCRCNREKTIGWTESFGFLFFFFLLVSGISDARDAALSHKICFS